ncbi:MAG: noncanonical pyrimidine nucleotidase, YjjG family [Bacteroidetes bacterium]|nr:noncanonical pyrimidine nucleotidase, YjjG family [Bacteroidota bacterium]
MSKYKHLFFDLDNTLWDFERNSTEALTELYHKYSLQKLGVSSLEIFLEKYKERNAMMWDEYRLGKIDKATLRDKRFQLTFWDMGLDAETAPNELPDEYLRISPRKTHLFPHAHETLSYLCSKYTLHIITNGFVEAQEIKLQASDLEKYFAEIIISEHTGYKKPDINIFNYSMQKAGASSDECVMIGDGLDVDIAGARNAGWDTVYFNPFEIPHTDSVTFEIKSLDELTRLF